MSFPVDVSGGVARFRHRWSHLQRLELELGARTLERWAAPRLRGLVGIRTPDVWVALAPSSATICVAATVDADEQDARAPVVAFDVHVLSRGADLALVVTNARGSELPATATAMAIACVKAVLGPSAERHGAEFSFRRAGAAVARALLPEAGARVPESDNVTWAILAANADTWILQAGRDALPAAPSRDAIVAHEVAAVLAAADDLLVDGNLVEARAAYLEALERAPRHAEIARRIADIDVRTPGRAEAALAMLAEARERGAKGDLGVTRGELLLEVGDLEGALANLEGVGERERAPALGSRAFELAARATRDIDTSLRWLDASLARSPRSTTPRWARAEKRLLLGRLEDALADVEHLEALTRGTAAKHAVWLRAGRMWQMAGLGRHAAPLFERALRFAPDEAGALVGLGGALVAEGHAARGAAILGRALALAEQARGPTSAIRIALARTLAEKLDDLPTAIAHAAAIPSDAVEAIDARGLEGRWRALLGDLVGSGLAFARMRELAATISTTEEPRARLVAALLVEAAQVEKDRRQDPLAARRYLGDALRLLPRDRELGRLYKEACDAAIRGPDEVVTCVGSEAIPPAATASEAHAHDEDVELATRVEELTRKLHASPRDAATVDELAGLLEALGRGHELLALLSAGLADADVARRAVLAPRARAALERLAAQAAAEGRREEAALYRDAATTLTS